MDQRELSYLNERAAAEMKAAQQAASVLAARPHYRLAAHYLDQAEALERRLRWQAAAASQAGS